MVREALFGRPGTETDDASVGVVKDGDGRIGGTSD